jgi:hypothetical protein
MPAEEVPRRPPDRTEIGARRGDEDFQDLAHAGRMLPRRRRGRTGKSAGWEDGWEDGNGVME